MPIYEYECEACHSLFERRQRFDEEPVAVCPKCQGKARRVIHSVPIIFKGSGFYITDNRKSQVAEPVKDKKQFPVKSKESSSESATPAS